MTNTPDHSTGSRRPSGLGYVVIAAFALTIVVSVWALIVRLDRASYVSHVIDGSMGFSNAEATAKDNHVRGASIAVVLTLLATATVFITWFAIVVRRLHQARPGEFRHGPGWAIGGWFVPVVNLVYPKQMADDAWRAATARTQPVPAAFHFWWASWLLGNIVIVIGNGITNSNASSLIANGDRIAAVGYGISVVAAILAIVVVTKLDVAAQSVEPMPSNAWAANAWPAAPMSPGSPWPAQQSFGQPLVEQQPLPEQQPQLRFNPPPGWPTPPPGWVPPPGWQPDPSWPPPPENWPFWLPANPT